ncbi:hypothetical protein C627_05495 [Corynebacterium glutamicum ZL-6]|nr:hypothetical protein C628_05520 [[Brevibacterium] flavum ZL-1]ANR65081.1 hypothetical protein C627_05495 [Corynebacterium glutamicum ZL-6]PST76515.1 hypothetical protein I919_05577 [Corynebacterium glutamicum ZL-2]
MERFMVGAEAFLLFGVKWFASSFFAHDSHVIDKGSGVRVFDCGFKLHSVQFLLFCCEIICSVAEVQPHKFNQCVIG